MIDQDKAQYEKLLPKFNAKTLTKQEAVSFMRLARIKEQDAFGDSLHAAQVAATPAGSPVNPKQEQ